MKNLTLLFLFGIILTTPIFAQNTQDHTLIQRHLQTSALEKNLQQNDIANYVVTSYHTSKQSGITHYYIQQTHDGIPVHNAVVGLHVDKDGEVVQLHNQFISDVAQKINTKNPALDASTTLARVTTTMEYDRSELPSLLERTANSTAQQQVFSKGSISREDIPVQLMYVPMKDGSLRLSWDMSIAEIQDADWWSMRVDAQTGEILNKINWTVYCNFDEGDGCSDASHIHHHVDYCSDEIERPQRTSSLNAPDSYRVYPEPTESPSHGIRQLVVNPADAVASPFGWHDNNGANGAEFTITRGNNVWAQDDLNGNNGTGFSPDGGASLDFDFGLDLTVDPSNSPNLESGIVNLFYWNNLTHDVWYHYGFDEASGNFQDNNYGNGGTANDYVLADAQDGGGTNNANFSAPTDGSNGRMQMFVWTGASAGTLTVNSPGSIADVYSSAPAQFGSQSYNLSGDLVIYNDGTAAPTEGCNAAVNAAAINGNIALIDRGTCEFGAKALNAQNAGAIAVIVCNNAAGGTISMGPGTDGANVTIPTIMTSQSECATIRAQIPTVNVTMVSGNSVNRDGDLDNLIIAHEYGHGISIRLAGGRNNSSCLNNNEQMGEGWSDWFGLMMTIKSTDDRNKVRPVGTFAGGEATTGAGIRTYPYTCDLSINPHSYNDIGGESIPHGVGSVWCAMLWEMSWDLMDAYGYDSNIHTGTGGNNIAMTLVIEALKLQPCSPGFVDGRDAIIAADQALYNGAYNCIIRNAFARRGLGDNASQGGTGSTTDGTEDFNTSAGTCVQATCTDGVQNGNETGIDCGGPDCPVCPPTCTDGIQNGSETGIDCGGPDCEACPTCTDGIQNGDETGIDCGGSCPDLCPTCTDGKQNGSETGVDCGGPDCPPCPTCTDGIQNGNELGIDCGGSDCPACPQEDCALFDFTNSILSYDAGGNDQGTATIQDAGATVFITGNAWKAVEVNYTVTANTVIEFDFRSGVEGEIHEVSFDNDLLIDREHRHVIYGNQGFTGDYVNQVYTGSGNWEHFVIHIGANFTGTYQYMLLTADDDANSLGESYFRNFQMYEDYDGNLMCDNSCPSVLSLTTPVPTGVYPAGVEVNCNTNVDASSDVIFQAGDIIKLENGFSTPVSTDFDAIIQGCDNN